MKFTDIFIQRPVLAMVLSALILMFGFKSIFDLEVRQYPAIERAVITITTAYPGASADLMQGFVSSPIMSAISSAVGIDYITSISQQSSSVITVNLILNADVNRSFSEIQAKVSSVQNLLPEGSQLPVFDISTGDTLGLMYIGYGSDELIPSQLYDYLDRVIRPKLETVQGVAQAQILGGNPFAMRVWLDAERMAGLNISVDDVYNALSVNNYTSAAGSTKGYFTALDIYANTDATEVEEFKKIIVKQENDTLIYLSDISEVDLGALNYDISVNFNGKEGVFIGIFGTPNANPLTVIKDIRKLLPVLEKDLPASITQDIVYDSTIYIQDSIDEVVKTIFEASLIVIVVMYLFLGSFRAVLIPIMTIPLSLIGVTTLMSIFGYSINLMTLLAMVLAIGMVVDDAIIVVENVFRHIEEGRTPTEAAVIGAREISGAVITMTITLGAVYAPVAFLGGLTGSLFQEFALTLAAAVVISGVIALTLSPMMCSKFLRAHNESHGGGFSGWLDKKFTQLENGYHRFLVDVLDARVVVLTFGILVLPAIYILFVSTPSTLVPSEDQGFIMVQGQASSDVTLDYTKHYTNLIGETFKTFPEYSDSFLISGTPSVNSSFGGMVAKPWSERDVSINRNFESTMSAKLNTIAGLQTAAFLPPPISSLPQGLPIQMAINSTADFDILYDLANDISQKAIESRNFLFTQLNMAYDNGQLFLAVDKQKALEMGISMREIGQALALFFGENFVNQVNIDQRSYQIIPLLTREQRKDPDILNSIYLKTQYGSLVPASSVIDYEVRSVPNQLNNFQQLNSVMISALPSPTLSDTQAINYFMDIADKILPQGFSYDFAGQSRYVVDEGSALVVTFGFALIVIFLVLAAQFESLRDPLVIMCSVPMAIIGALIFLFLGFGNANLNIYSELGLITLVGLITKHGVLMVEFANQIQRDEGLCVRKAIEKSAAMRLRPILMTTAAMVVGVLPLIIASGPGSSSRYNIGLVIATGLSIGTLFTLFVIPTMYTYIVKPHKPIPNLADIK